MNEYYGGVIFEAFISKKDKHEKVNADIVVYCDGNRMTLKYTSLNNNAYLIDCIYRFPLEVRNKIEFNVDGWLNVGWDKYHVLYFYKGKKLLTTVSFKFNEGLIIINNFESGQSYYCLMPDYKRREENDEQKQ